MKCSGTLFYDGARQNQPAAKSLGALLPPGFAKKQRKKAYPTMI
jgi:hypothetical protein